MENHVSRISQKFLGYKLSGSVHDKRRICIQLIKKIVERHNVEALKNNSETLAIGNLGLVSNINIEAVYNFIVDLHKRYLTVKNGGMTKATPKTAEGVVFTERRYNEEQVLAWSDNKYIYIKTVNEDDSLVINARALNEFIEQRTDKDYNIIRLVYGDSPYTYLKTTDGETLTVNSWSRCFSDDGLYACQNIILDTDWYADNIINLSHMFYGCSQLINISALSNWNVSNVENMQYMFTGCSQLIDISALSNWNVSNVRDMSYMFGGCSQLSNILGLLNWDVHNVEDMQYMFYGCSRLTYISALSNWNVSNVANMRSMFGLCSQLIYISALSDWIVSNVENMYFMFGGCEQLKDITALSNWDVSNVEDMQYMFSECALLPDAIKDASSTEAVKAYLAQLKNAQ